MAKDAKAREVRFYAKHDGRVFLHPASTNFSVGRFESPWLVYSEKVRTSKVRADKRLKRRCTCLYGWRSFHAILCPCDS